MQVKTLKTINGCFWAAIALALNIGVVYQWSGNDRKAWSIFAACLVFSVFCACLWYAIHNHINEANR